MTTHQTSPEIEALVRRVSGNTLAFGAFEEGDLADTRLCSWAEKENATDSETLEGVEPGSADAIVALFALETCVDPVAVLTAWDRSLREAGSLAVVLRGGGEPVTGDRHHFAPQALVNLMNRSGGLQATSVKEITPGRSWLITAVSTAVAGIRLPFGTSGGQWARLAAIDLAARAEFYFQTGMIFLQSGDPVLAQACFKRQLELEPGKIDGQFGLGMALGGQGRWFEALTQLQQVQRINPHSEEICRWVDTAREHVRGG